MSYTITIKIARWAQTKSDGSPSKAGHGWYQFDNRATGESFSAGYQPEGWVNTDNKD